LILLFFILLWQGGPYAVTLLLILYQSSRSDISDKLLFTVGVMRDIGQQGNLCLNEIMYRIQITVYICSYIFNSIIFSSINNIYTTL